MFHNEENTPATSESSQADVDLYSMGYNYTEQLNLVRKNLNLMELSDRGNQGCTITEIVEDEPGSCKQDEGARILNSALYGTPMSNDRLFKEARKPKGLELTTIHPFSLNCNMESGSSTNIFESDYSPPTKKVCQRLKTPRFTSASEGNVPYHTKIGIHDSLFKEETNPQEKTNNFVSNVAKEFTETRQTQCNEEEFKNIKSVHENVNVETPSQCTGDRFSILNLSFETETDTEYESPNSGSLFPNVIIEAKETHKTEESSLSSQFSYRKNRTNTSSSRNILSLNSVRGSSDEDESCTVKITKTTINTAGQKKKHRNKMFMKQEASEEKLSMFEEITRLRSGTNDNTNLGQGDAETGDASYDICKLNRYIGQLSQKVKLAELTKSSHVEGKSKLNQYIQQYVQYKNEVDKIATAKKHNKHSIIGQKVVNIQNRIMDSPDKLYQSENSLVSDEEKTRKLDSSLSDSNDSEDKRRFWEKLCYCLCPSRNFND